MAVCFAMDLSREFVFVAGLQINLVLSKEKSRKAILLIMLSDYCWTKSTQQSITYIFRKLFELVALWAGCK